VPACSASHLSGLGFHDLRDRPSRRRAVASKPQPQPLKGFPPAAGWQASALPSLIQKEGPTYNWLWHAVRNMCAQA
jgi:hypothetical protein